MLVYLRMKHGVNTHQQDPFVNRTSALSFKVDKSMYQSFSFSFFFLSNFDCAAIAIAPIVEYTVYGISYR